MDEQQFTQVIELLPNKFSSHLFIEKFIQEYEADYIRELVPERGGFRKLNSEIGRFLSTHSQTLHVEKIGEATDENVKGYDSPNALWRKTN